MKFQQCSINGSLQPIDSATISYSNIEYCYGFGVYESIRIAKAVPYFIDLHVERLQKSADIIGLEHTWDSAQIKTSIEELIESVEEETYNLKMLLIGERSPENAQLIILPLAPRFPEKKWYKTGVKVITQNHERPFPNAKSLNMLPSYIAYREAKKSDAYDALLIDREGNLLEGTRTNLFAIKDRTLITPPTDRVLEGVTRKLVMHVANENKYTIEEHDISLSDLDQFDGLFITSTSSKILPIRQVDKQEIGKPCDALKELMDLFRNFLEESNGTF